MSFDISQSFQITHDTSLTTIKLFTESQYFSPIEELDSATSSIIIPRVLFQSNLSNKKKESESSSNLKETSKQKLINNIHYSARNHLLPFLSNNQLCQSIDIDDSNSKIIKHQQEEDSNLLSSPKVQQAQSYRMPHMIRLFQESSIDEIPENSVHNIEIRFEESGKKSENNNLFLSKGWGYRFARDQLEILKNNVEKLKVMDQNSSQINNMIHPSTNQVQLFQKQFLKSNGLTTCEDKMLASIDAKSTKSQQIKNQQLDCARVISQFHNDFEVNEQEERNQQYKYKIINTTPQRRFNTSQDSSRKLMQRKIMISGLKSKEIHSA